MNFALWKKKVGDTEYGLGWFPLGGYVDIAGMVDETKDAAALSAEPQPWEFRSKPAWQRMLVMLGGIIVNVLLGMLIYSGVKYVWGETDYAKEELNKSGVFAYPVAEKIGLKTGDKIVKINGSDYSYYSDITAAIVKENTTFTVQRGDSLLDIYVPNELINDVAKKKMFITPLFEFEIQAVSKGSAADESGLRVGDKITTLNGEPVKYYQEFTPKLRAQAGKKVELGILRNGTPVTINPTVSADSTIGFTMSPLLNVSKAEFSLGEAIYAGSAEALSIIPQQINGFARIFKGHIAPQNALTGPVGLAQMFSPHWDWEKFWILTGMLSMALAFMNALPIPALDGGHVVMLIYEMIAGKAPSEKFMERTQQVGTFILLALMLYVLFNDTVKLF